MSLLLFAVAALCLSAVVVAIRLLKLRTDGLRESALPRMERVGMAVRQETWGGAWFLVVSNDPVPLQKVLSGCKMPAELLDRYSHTRYHMVRHQPGPWLEDDKAAQQWVQRTAAHVADLMAPASAQPDGDSGLAILYASQVPPPAEADLQSICRYLDEHCSGVAFVSGSADSVLPYGAARRRLGDWVVRVLIGLYGLSMVASLVAGVSWYWDEAPGGSLNDNHVLLVDKGLSSKVMAGQCPPVQKVADGVRAAPSPPAGAGGGGVGGQDAGAGARDAGAPGNQADAGVKPDGGLAAGAGAQPDGGKERSGGAGSRPDAGRH